MWCKSSIQSFACRQSPGAGSVQVFFLLAACGAMFFRVCAADIRLAPPLDRVGGSSLHERYDRLFIMGVALDGNLPEDYNAGELRLIGTQFAALTPVNCMKMTHLQPVEGRFDFRMADRLVAFAATNRLKVCGHCLVWAKDERTPQWVFRDGEKPSSRELLMQRMQTHIQNVAGRYRGKVISWDVVNEALDDGTNFIRASTWFSTLGEEFIVKAFQFARELKGFHDEFLAECAEPGRGPDEVGAIIQRFVNHIPGNDLAPVTAGHVLDVRLHALH